MPGKIIASQYRRQRSRRGPHVRQIQDSLLHVRAHGVRLVSRLATTALPDDCGACSGLTSQLAKRTDIEPVAINIESGHAQLSRQDTAIIDGGFLKKAGRNPKRKISSQFIGWRRMAHLPMKIRARSAVIVGKTVEHESVFKRKIHANLAYHLTECQER